MKKLLLLVGFLVCLQVVLGGAPVTQSVSILPEYPTAYDDLLGYCNVTDVDSGNISYEWKWFNNSVLFSEHNVSGFFCYQEFANESTSCGGVANPDAYGSEGNFDPLGPAYESYDGNYSGFSFAYPVNGQSTKIYINYTKPQGFTNQSLWQLEMNDSVIVNYSLPQSCFENSPLMFKVEQYKNGSSWNANASCYTGVAWQIIDETTLGAFYEEAMNWNILNNQTTEGIMLNLQNVSNTVTSVGDNWTFSCRGFDGLDYSSWLNSSSHPLFNSYLELNFFNVSNYELLNSSTTSVTLIGDSVTYTGSTSNGSILFQNINRDNYRVVIENPGFDDKVVYASLFNSALMFDLYLETGTLDRTFRTQDALGVDISNASIIFFRNINGSYIVSAQEITDFSGRATVSLVPSVIYRLVVVKDGYSTFVGNVQPTESDYSIVLSEISFSPLTSIYENFGFVTNYSQNKTNNSLSSVFIVVSSLSELEYFGSNVTYNSVNYFENSTNPTGGEIDFKITDLNISQVVVEYNYWFKLLNHSPVTWTETVYLDLTNVTDITLTGGLFSEIESIPISNPVRGFIGLFIVLLLIFIFGVLTRMNVFITVIAGLAGLGVNYYFELWPKPLIAVAVSVALLLLIADSLGGGK